MTPTKRKHRVRTQENPEHVGTILLWGTTSVVVLVLLLAWMRGFFFAIRNETIEKYYLSSKNFELEELRAREDSLLTTYGWVDKEKGIARIPIERAMELVAQESEGSRP